MCDRQEMLGGRQQDRRLPYPPQPPRHPPRTVEPQRADAEPPVHVKAAAPHQSIAAQLCSARQRNGVEAIPHVQPAALLDCVGDEIGKHAIVASTVEGNAVGENGQLDGVVPDRHSLVRVYRGPQGDGVVASVAEAAVADGDVRPSNVQVQPVRGGVANDDASDEEVVARPVEPHTDLGVLNEHLRYNARRWQRAWHSGGTPSNRAR